MQCVKPAGPDRSPGPSPGARPTRPTRVAPSRPVGAAICGSCAIDRLEHVSAPRLSEFIKAYDVRGLVPQQLNDAVAFAIGSAFSQVVALPDGATSFVIGHDMRESSPDLSRAFAAGAAANGVDVTLIGLCSTDGLYYASGALDVPDAMFTASHNPAQYNGIKLCRSGARPVGQDTGLGQIKDLAQSLLDSGDVPQTTRGDVPTGSTPGDAPTGSSPRTSATPTGTISERDVLADYALFLRGLVDLRANRPLTVVVDAGNGIGGHTVPAVLGTHSGLPALPLTVIPLYFELDGTFPNHEANPLAPENLVDLQAAVIAHGADLGLAPLVHHEATSGVTVEREPRVGHSFIKGEMARHQAVFGGEHSGHYYFRDFWFADTGMLAAMHVLAALGEQAGPLSELGARFSRYSASGEINSTVADAPLATENVRAWAQQWAREHGQDVAFDELDGMTVTHQGTPMWWFNLRASNTEPLLRLNVEASDEATMARVRDDLLSVVRGERA